MVNESQTKANNKWKAKNKSKQRIYQYRSQARKYVRDIASKDDLMELQQMIEERLKEL